MARLRRKYQSLEKAYKALEEENDTVKEQLKQREESLEDANTQVRERERQLQTAHQVSGLVNLAQVLCVGCLIPVLGALLLLLLAQPLLPPPLKVELNASRSSTPLTDAAGSSNQSVWRRILNSGAMPSSRYFPTLPPGPREYIWSPWKPDEPREEQASTQDMLLPEYCPVAPQDSEQEGTRNRGVRLPLGGMAVLRLMVVLSAAIGFLDSVISSHFCINCACCFVVNGYAELERTGGLLDARRVLAVEEQLPITCEVGCPPGWFLMERGPSMVYDMEMVPLNVSNPSQLSELLLDVLEAGRSQFWPFVWLSKFCLPGQAALMALCAWKRALEGDIEGVLNYMAMGTELIQYGMSCMLEHSREDLPLNATVLSDVLQGRVPLSLQGIVIDPGQGEEYADTAYR
ncbi:hypothetical protein FOZ62_029866, partial [Perkinsus olseni]